MLWVWASIALFVVCGVALIIWRKELTSYQEMVLGGRMHPGCAVVEGVLLIFLALGYFLLYLAGVF
jgi:hypothetical protein